MAHSAVASVLQQRVASFLAADERRSGVAPGHERSLARDAQEEWEASLLLLRAEIQRMADWGFTTRSGAGKPAAIGGLRGSTSIGTSSDDIATSVLLKFLCALRRGDFARAASASWIRTTCARELYDLSGKAAREPMARDLLPHAIDGEQSSSDCQADTTNPEQEIESEQFRRIITEILNSAHLLIRGGRTKNPDDRRWLWYQRRLCGESWNKILQILPAEMSELPRFRVNLLEQWVVRYHQALRELAKQPTRLSLEQSKALARLLDYIDDRDDAAASKR